MAETEMTTGNGTSKNKMTLMGAIFIGIGSMVGAGIFALFGEAGGGGGRGEAGVGGGTWHEGGTGSATEE